MSATLACVGARRGEALGAVEALERLARGGDALPARACHRHHASALDATLDCGVEERAGDVEVSRASVPRSASMRRK
jgi:predicted ATPase